MALVALVGASAAVGCRRGVDIEDAKASVRRGAEEMDAALRSGPRTILVSGASSDPRGDAELSGWAAEELGALLAREGFADFVDADDGEAVAPVEQVEVVPASEVDDVKTFCEARDAEVIVFVDLRSITTNELGPRVVDWSYDGSVEILVPKTDGRLEWAVAGTSRTEAPNELPEDPEAARRPLAERWARRALSTGKLGTGAFRALGG